MNNVLITGCNGYLGVEMCMYFRAHGWRVYGVDPKPAPKCQERVLEDFENKHIQELMAPPWVVDAVIHLGGASKIADDIPDSYYTKHNVDTTAALRELYPAAPLYLASTTAMYNEAKQIEHLHAYTRSKQEAEVHADVVFRMGTIVGVNRAGGFVGFIDKMIDNAIRNREIVVAQGEKMRPLAGLTYICMMYYRSVASGERQWPVTSSQSPVKAKGKVEGGKRRVVHLYETCQSIENTAVATHRGLYALPQKRYDAAKIDFVRRNDLSGMLKQAPAISSVPPDFRPNPLYDVRLYRLVMECLERYECFKSSSQWSVKAVASGL